MSELFLHRGKHRQPLHLLQFFLGILSIQDLQLRQHHTHFRTICHNAKHTNMMKLDFLSYLFIEIGLPFNTSVLKLPRTRSLFTATAEAILLSAAFSVRKFCSWANPSNEMRRFEEISSDTRFTRLLRPPSVRLSTWLLARLSYVSDPLNTSRFFTVTI